MEKLIDEGWVISTTDTSVYLKDQQGISFSLPVNSIGKIKTGKSGEPIILGSTLAGAATGALLGFAWDEMSTVLSFAEYDENTGLISGAVVGAACGLIVGAVITSNSKTTFVINGDLQSWGAFQSYVKNRIKRVK